MNKLIVYSKIVKLYIFLKTNYQVLMTFKIIYLKFIYLIIITDIIKNIIKFNCNYKINYIYLIHFFKLLDHQ